MIILRNPQIAELIDAGCAFKSNVIISKNETKKSQTNQISLRARWLFYHFISQLGLFALKYGQKSAIYSMKAVFRSDFQTILTAFPTFTHGK